MGICGTNHHFCHETCKNSRNLKVERENRGIRALVLAIVGQVDIVIVLVV